MPRPRLIRLAQEKRDAILGAAMDEFATHGYHDASYNRIIQQAGVSKGGRMCRFAHILAYAVAAIFTINVLVSASALGAQWGNCPDEVRDLVDKADRVTRGDSSRADASMKVFKRGTVSIRMQMWSEGRDKFLAKVTRPSRLRGMATLKSGDNLWNYLPRMDRVVKLGSSMMGGSWMGSHFTNDDLVKETDLRKHYTCASYKKIGDGFVVSLKPRPNAPVVWGRLDFKVRTDGPMPVWSKYYDERGKLKRTMRFEDVKRMGGRKIPTRFVLQPADAPSERTEFVYHDIAFDIKIPQSKFTLRGLKR